MSKKIAIVARWPIGGIRTYINYIFSRESFSSYSYTLITPALELKLYFDEVFKNSDFSYIEVEKNGKGLFFSTFKQLAFSKTELLHSHGLTAGLLVSPIAWILRVPHIVTLHDVFLPGHFESFQGKIKYNLINIALKLPTVINPCGFDAADNLRSTFPKVPSKKIQPVRNGIDVEAFSVESTRNIRSELGLTEDTLLLGFFGRFMRQKGFDLLVKAVKTWSETCPEKPLHIACFGWGAFIREEQENITKLRLNKYFTFMPHTDDMPAALRGVDAAVMPSRWEACPLLPMEAMSSGAVVLASDCIGMKEVCVDSPALVFNSEKVGDLYQKMHVVASSRRELYESAQQFKVEARKRFDVENTARELAEIYQAVLGDD